MVVGLLAAMLLKPGSVVSAVSSTYVALTNSNGTRSVGITKAKQLLTAATDAGDIVLIQGPVGTSCTTLYTVPAGKNLIIKTGRFVIIPTSAGVFMETDLYQDCLRVLTVAGNTAHVVTEQAYGEGIVVPGGSTVDAWAFDGFSYVVLHGHLVAMNSPAP